MDKNFIIAFLLIIGSFIFFNSDLYNYRLLHKEKPIPNSEVPYKSDLNSKKVIIPDSSPVKASSNSNDVKSFLPFQGIKDSLIFQKQKKIIVVSDLYIAEFTTLGARAISWKMKNYKDKNGEYLDLIPENSEGMLNFSLDKINFDYILFESDIEDTIFVNDKSFLSFKGFSGDSIGVEKIITFTKGKYDFDVSMHLIGNSRGENYNFGWKSGIFESEAKSSELYSDNSVSVYFGDDVDNPVDKNDTVKNVEGLIKWVSLRSKYFSGTFMPEKAVDYDISFRKIYDYERTNNEQNYSFLFNGKVESGKINYKIILCPNKYSILDSYDIKLEKIIFTGYTWFFRADIWFPPLCGLILDILNFFYGLIPNYGIAILFLTLLSKIVTLPLTMKSSKSMARMKLLQPKIDAIRAQYKSDPLSMNKAVMKLYKDEGVNPIGAGGCLPMILQMPIFIALFVALRKSIELRGAPFLLWITDLSGPEALYMLPSKVFFYGPNVSVLTFIMAITMFFQSKQTMTDPKQKSLIYIMPLVMLFMLNSMPAGLMLYWSFSNILGILQNVLIKVNPEDLKNKPRPKRSLFKAPSYNEMLKRMGRK